MGDCGALGHRSLSMSPISCREQTPASMTFPEFQRTNLNSCQSRKGQGRWRVKGGAVRKQQCCLETGSWFLLKDKHNNVFKLFIELKLYFCFVDYAKAFDCVDHNKLWKILQEIGIPDHLTCLLRKLFAGQEATVRTGHGTTDWFQVGKRSMSRLYTVTLLI